MSVCSLRICNKRIPTLADDGTWLRNALEIPIVGPIIGVQLPVIARGVVAAVTVERAVQIVQLRCRRVRYSINVWIDRAAARVGIDGDCYGSILRAERKGKEKQRENE